MAKVHVYWSRNELGAVLDFLRRSELFVGRREALVAVEDAVARKAGPPPASKKAKRSRQGTSRPPRVMLDIPTADDLAERLLGAKSKAANRAGAYLERATREARLRGHPRGTNVAAKGRNRRVSRGDAGQLDR